MAMQNYMLLKVQILVSSAGVVAVIWAVPEGE